MNVIGYIQNILVTKLTNVLHVWEKKEENMGSRAHTLKEKKRESQSGSQTGIQMKSLFFFSFCTNTICMINSFISKASVRSVHNSCQNKCQPIPNVRQAQKVRERLCHTVKKWIKKKKVSWEWI